MYRLITFWAILNLVGAASIPNFFEKCKKNDPKLNDCLTKSANKGWPKFVEGYNLKKIILKEVPIEFPNIVKGHTHGGHMLGYDNIVFDSIKIDFNKKTFEVIYSQPLLVIHGDNYDVYIDFVGLNLDDKGSGNATFTDNIFKYSFDYDVVERDGEEYMQLKNPKLTYNTNKLTFIVSSSVNKQRGAQLTNLFNNFWRLFNIIGEVPIAKFIADGIQPVVEKYLSSIPIKSMFM